MGSRQSEPEKEPPTPPAPPQRSFSVSSAEAQVVTRCHAALTSSQKGSATPTITVEGIKQHFRVPETIAQWMVGQHGDGTGISAEGLLAAVNSCADPSQKSAKRRAVMFEAFAQGGLLTQATLEELLWGSVEIASTLAEDFAFVQPNEMFQGATAPRSVVKHLASKLTPASADLPAFERFVASNLLTTVGDGLPLLLMEKCRQVASMGSSEGNSGIEEEDQEAVQTQIMRLMPLVDGTKMSDIFTPELAWGFALVWDGACPITRLYASSSDGFSMRTTLNAIQGYKGPTIILVRDRFGRVFGGYVATEWKDGCATKRVNFLNDRDCYLFSLHEASACEGIKTASLDDT